MHFFIQTVFEKFTSNTLRSRTKLKGSQADIHYLFHRNVGIAIQELKLQIAAFGMLLSFPFEGYVGVSISFSTLFVAVSYWFHGDFFKDFRIEKGNAVSIWFARMALVFLVISSIGPFCLGPIMANGEEVHIFILMLFIFTYIFNTTAGLASLCWHYCSDGWIYNMLSIPKNQLFYFTVL